MIKNHMDDMYKRPITSGEKALTYVQVKQLIGVVDQMQHLVLFKIAVSCGLRRSDIVGIETSNIDVNNLSIRFYQHKKSNWHTVFVSRDIMSTIEMYMNMNKKQRWLFPSHHNGKSHISDKTAYNILQRYLIKAGLPQRPFHSLRATCVKLCQANGWSAEQVAKHIDDKISTVQQHYSTPSLEERKSIAQEKSIL